MAPTGERERSGRDGRLRPSVSPHLWRRSAPAVDNEVPSAVEGETGPAAVRRVPQSPLDALPVHALVALGIVVVVQDVGPRQVVGGDVKDVAHFPRHLDQRAHHEERHCTSTRCSVVPLERGDHRPVGARQVAVKLIDPCCAPGILLPGVHKAVLMRQGRPAR